MNPTKEIIDLAALEQYLEDDSYDSDDDSSYYSSDEESVDGVADPILDTLNEKLMVHDLKQKARACRLKRRAAKKAAKKEASDLKEAQAAQIEDPTEEASESGDSYALGDDDSIHTHLKRSTNSSANFLFQEDSLEIEDDGEFDDFEEYDSEEEEEVEVELPFDLSDRMAQSGIRV